MIFTTGPGGHPGYGGKMPTPAPAWSHTLTATRRGVFDPVSASYVCNTFDRVFVIVDCETDQWHDTMTAEEARAHFAKFRRKWRAVPGEARYPNGARSNRLGWQVPR